MLKLMYITNKPEVAQIAESAGADRIFVDLEYIGKALRQGGMDTVQSHHTAEDVAKIREAVTKADVMVRINPIHEAAKEYASSKEEIETTNKFFCVWVYLTQDIYRVGKWQRKGSSVIGNPRSSGSD